jgi:putative zinc finger protein
MVDYPAGWTCERTVLRFELYLLGTLPLSDALAVAEHLEACEGCPQRLVLYRLTLAERFRG